MAKLPSGSLLSKYLNISNSSSTLLRIVLPPSVDCTFYANNLCRHLSNAKKLCSATACSHTYAGAGTGLCSPQRDAFAPLRLDA
eukprot:6183065-Pleurochrysis_carterae.AAC.1